MQRRFSLVVSPPLPICPWYSQGKSAGTNNCFPTLNQLCTGVECVFSCVVFSSALGFITLCAWFVFWVFSFCIHLYLMRPFLWDQQLLFKRTRERKCKLKKHRNTAIRAQAPTISAIQKTKLHDVWKLEDDKVHRRAHAETFHILLQHWRGWTLRFPYIK